MKKKLMALFLSALMLFSMLPVSALAADGPKITVESKTVDVSEGALEVKIGIKDNPGIAGLDLTVNAPEGWTLDDEYAIEQIEDGALSEYNSRKNVYSAVGTLTPNPEAGNIVWAYTADITSDGDMFLLYYTVPSTEVNGEYEISVTVNSINNAENTGTNIGDSFTVTPGTITVTGGASATPTTLEVSGDASVDVPTAAVGTASTDAFTATVKDQKGNTMSGQSVTWSITSAAGVSISNHGIVTVTNEAQAGELTVTAKCGSVQDTATLTVKRAAPVLTSAEFTSGDETIAVPLAENGVSQWAESAAAYKAQGLDQFGAKMNAEFTLSFDAEKWSENYNKEKPYYEYNLKFVDAQGGQKVSVSSHAPAGSITITATAKTKDAVTATKTITFTKNASVVTTLAASPSDLVVYVPAEGTATVQDGDEDVVYYATGFDQYGWWMDDPGTIEWSINPANKGVSFNAATKKVTVDASAKNYVADTTGETYYVNAKIGNIVMEETTHKITVKRAASVATAFKVTKNGAELTGDTDTIIIPVSDENTYTYAAAVLDQYGAKMADATLAFATANEKVTYAAGIVTVKEGATKDSTYTLTASYAGMTDKVVTLTAKDIDITWPEARTNNLVYGHKWSEMVALGSGSASLNGENVPGVFALKTPDEVPAAGEKTYVVSFASTDGQYNVEQTYAAVTIAKLPVTLAWGEASLTYDGTEQSVTAQVTNAVGEDSFTLSYSDNAKTNVGTYTATVTGLGNDNYTLEGVTATKEWTISAKALTAAMVTLGDEPNYNEKEQTIEVTVADGGSALVKDTDYTVSGNTATAVGSYTLTVTGQGNYTGKVEKSWQMLKTEQPTPVVLTGADSKTFGDEPFEVTVSGGSGTGAYSVVSSDTDVLTVAPKAGTSDTFVVTIVNAGEASLTATKAGDANYADRASEAFTVTVEKATRTVSVGSSSVTLLPNALSASITPAVSAGDADVTYTYTSSDTSVVTVNKTGAITAVANGAATITVTASGKNYKDASKTVTVTAWATVPVEGVTVGEKQTAMIDGSKIIVSGIKDNEETPVTVTLVFENDSGFTQVAGENGKIDVKFNDTVAATYTVDTSAVIVKPANVTVKDEIRATVDFSGLSGTLAQIAGGLVNDATKGEGMNEAAPAVIKNAAEDLPEGATKVEVTMSLTIQPTEYSATEGKEKLTLDITPTVTLTYKDDDGAQVGAPTTETIPNSQITAPITISIKLPTGFPTEHLYAKHYLNAEKTQYEMIPVTVDIINGVATWQQSSFSTVELVADTRTATVEFELTDESKQSFTLKPENIGNVAFPVDTESGKTFNGWNFYVDGSETAVAGGPFTTLTDELLKALDDARTAGHTVTVKPAFTQISSDSSGGAAPTAEVSVGKADNGTVSASVAKAKKGDTVTVTVTPKDGYKLDTLTITDKNGKTVTLKKVSDTKYTFTMPDGKVSIAATFVEGKTETAMSFADVVTNDWYYDAVKYAFDNGLMNGTGDGKFSPNATTTRGMIFTVLARNAGVDTTGGETWYTVGMNWAKEQGISDGTMPEGNITREQLATMLYRYALLKGVDTKKYTENTNTLSHTDVFTISDWASEGMHFCIAAGVIGGDTNGMLNPTNNATRAEVATMLMRYLELNK